MTHSLEITAADGSVHVRDGRGILPLWQVFTEAPELLRGASVEDRVIGLGAAVIMTYGGISRYRTAVISRDALDWFDSHNIPGTADQVVPQIINRSRTGRCPLETILSGTSRENYLAAIVAFANELRAY